MSAIGVTVIEDGEIANEFYTLVNPETRFDPFNIQLTGITPAAVETEPTFPELWEKLDSGRNFRRKLRTCQWIETWTLPCL